MKCWSTALSVKHKIPAHTTLGGRSVATPTWDLGKAVPWWTLPGASLIPSTARADHAVWGDSLAAGGLVWLLEYGLG